MSNMTIQGTEGVLDVGGVGEGATAAEFLGCNLALDGETFGVGVLVCTAAFGLLAVLADIMVQKWGLLCRRKFMRVYLK